MQIESTSDIIKTNLDLSKIIEYNINLFSTEISTTSNIINKEFEINKIIESRLVKQRNILGIEVCVAVIRKFK